MFHKMGTVDSLSLCVHMCVCIYIYVNISQWRLRDWKVWAGAPPPYAPLKWGIGSGHLYTLAKKEEKTHKRQASPLKVSECLEAAIRDSNTAWINKHPNMAVMSAEQSDCTKMVRFLVRTTGKESLAVKLSFLSYPGVQQKSTVPFLRNWDTPLWSHHCQS